jgi:hypothetical protein
MSTNGPAIERAIGYGVSFSGATLASNPSFQLAPGLYQLVLSQCDVNNPGSITITDPNSNALTFQKHGQFLYAAMGQPGVNGTTYTLTCTGGVDLDALTAIGNTIGQNSPPEVFGDSY